MKRIIFVPQYPTPMRYQEWWFTEFPKQFHQAGLDVYVLGSKKANEMKHRRGDMAMFSPINAAIEFECAQIDEYMDLELTDDDILFVADISFPGFFTNVLFHKRPKRAFAFCHATSKNKFDYFSKVFPSKFNVETEHSRLYEKIFVGSEYHKIKLGWKNTIVTRLPAPPMKIKKYHGNKEFFMSSVARPDDQKRDKDLEEYFNVVRIDEFENEFQGSWDDYFRFLQMSFCLLISAREETFGYQIIDAVMNDCIPLAPDRLCYPEILPEEYIYHDKYDLDNIRKKVMLAELGVPKLVCQEQIDNFYENIINIMTTEREKPF